MKKAFLFGASKLGESAFLLLKDTYDIIGFIDNDERKWAKQLSGLQIYSPDIIKEKDIEVIITSSYTNEIINQLDEMNFYNYSIFKFQVSKSSLANSNLYKNDLQTVSLGRLLSEIKTDLIINDLSFLAGGSSIMDYFFLKAIIQQCNLRTYLEIGTWTGESVSAVAEIAERCYSISLSDEDESLINGFKSYAHKMNFSRYFSKEKQNIVHFYGDSKNFDFTKIKEKIDLVFIDGDHSFEGIKKDSGNIFDLVGYEDSIVVWHDFKTVRNEIVSTTFNAIKAVVPEGYLKNIFAVQGNYCGIYIPEKYQQFFHFHENPSELYSYKINMIPKHNYLNSYK